MPSMTTVLPLIESKMKEKIAGKDARKRKVNVNGVGRMDGVAD